jgi:glycosyltransferase involved in cell wall biosynthesis
MRILVISNCRPGSGWGTYSNNLFEALHEFSSIRFINLFGSTSLKECTNVPLYEPSFLGINVNRIFGLQSEVFGRAFPRIYFNSLIKQIKHQRHEGLLLHFSYNLLPVITYEKEDIATIHDVIFTRKQFEFQKIERAYSNLLLKRYLKFKNIIVDSNYVRRELISLGFEGDIEVIYPPLGRGFFPIPDKRMIRDWLGLPQGKILILSVGNNKPWKNLVNVFKTVDQLGNDYCLVRVGSRIKNEIAFNNLSIEKLNLVFNASDVLLFPSLEEGFGFPLIEAFGSSLPAVVSDIEVFREVGKEAAIFIDPLDVRSIKKGIFEALSGREDLIERGFKRALDFNIDNFRCRMIEYYNKLSNWPRLI